MMPSVENTISDEINVARAVFAPQMVDEYGMITRAAFSLRHNETYISVCRMDVSTWKQDLEAIPQSTNRMLCGYAVLNVGEIRALNFVHEGHNIAFDVIDKHTDNNKSHAGIVLAFDCSNLKGDKNVLLKPLPKESYAAPLLLRVQSRLLKLAKKNYTKFKTIAL